MVAVAARYTFSFLVAISIVFGLFWLMQYLISTANHKLNEETSVHLVDFVRVKENEHIQHREMKPEKPPPPDEPPPQPPPPSMDNAKPEAQTMAVNAAPVQNKIALNAQGFGLAPADGEYLPLVKVQPVYPERALARGIEGYVIVEFTVTRQGTTKNVRVVEADPKGIFDSAAIQAAQKFKYKPRVVDGQPIEVPGVKNKITFKIEK